LGQGKSSWVRVAKLQFWKRGVRQKAEAGPASVIEEDGLRYIAAQVETTRPEVT